jgi:hypothetical protein
MTTEEKAKAYDEVLERVKPLYEWAKKDDNPMWSTYEYLFPQLAESENERIRKELVAFFIEVRNRNRDEGYWHGLKVADILFYLERQKEQKPAEWVLPEDFEEAVYKVANFISPFDSQDELRRVSHRFAEQLLSLAKKELDKPAEWSEEDEKKINFLSRLIEFQVKDDEYCFGDGRLISKQEAIEMLKSLRPVSKESLQSWKPSEEQMKSLAQARDYYMTGKIKLVGGHLAELYEQLKQYQHE